MLTDLCQCKGLNSRKDTNLVFSRVAMFHTRKIKKVEFHTSKNISKTKQSIMPSFVLYIEYTLNYTFIHFGMSISRKQGSLLIPK